MDGVIRTRVGYSGGTSKDPTYTRMGDHAETIEIDFDPAKISYEQVLDYFFRLHDPTTRNRQGNDIGTQYRSAIFYVNDEQKEVAERATKQADESGEWNNPVTTEITPATAFYSAEDYHQDYLQKNPGGYHCHILRD